MNQIQREINFTRVKNDIDELYEAIVNEIRNYRWDLRWALDFYKSMKYWNFNKYSCRYAYLFDRIMPLSWRVQADQYETIVARCMEQLGHVGPDFDARGFDGFAYINKPYLTTDSASNILLYVRRIRQKILKAICIQAKLGEQHESTNIA